MYCGFEYTPCSALRGRLVKIPSFENDFLLRGKTAKGIEKKKRNENGRRRERRDRVGGGSRER